jgi:hypothetical protein
MRAAQYDIYIEQGATFEVTFAWTNRSGTAVDLTDMDLAMKIRPTKDSSVTILAGAYDGGTDTPSGDIVFDEGGVTGVFSITISATETAALDFTQAVYDIEITDGTDISRVVEGRVFLSKEVTR